MNTREAGFVVARLRGQWPAVAADDISAREWLAVVCESASDVAQETCQLLIRNWTRDRPPRVADWNEIARGVTARFRLDREPRRELESGPPDPGMRERVHVLIEEARGRLDASKLHKEASA